jgi:hypothetical protein
MPPKITRKSGSETDGGDHLDGRRDALAVFHHLHRQLKDFADAFAEAADLRFLEIVGADLEGGLQALRERCGKIAAACLQQVGAGGQLFSRRADHHDAQRNS